MADLKKDSWRHRTSDSSKTHSHLSSATNKSGSLVIIKINVRSRTSTGEPNGISFHVYHITNYRRTQQIMPSKSPYLDHTNMDHSYIARKIAINIKYTHGWQLSKSTEKCVNRNSNTRQQRSYRSSLKYYRPHITIANMRSRHTLQVIRRSWHWMPSRRPI